MRNFRQPSGFWLFISLLIILAAGKGFAVPPPECTFTATSPTNIAEGGQVSYTISFSNFRNGMAVNGDTIICGDNANVSGYGACDIFKTNGTCDLTCSGYTSVGTHIVSISLFNGGWPSWTRVYCGGPNPTVTVTPPPPGTLTINILNEDGAMVDVDNVPINGRINFCPADGSACVYKYGRVIHNPIVGAISDSSQFGQYDLVLGREGYNDSWFNFGVEEIGDLTYNTVVRYDVQGNSKFSWLYTMLPLATEPLLGIELAPPITGLPVCLISADPASPELYQTVRFILSYAIDFSTGMQINSGEIDFGDGQTFQVDGLQGGIRYHSYNAPGSYTPTLTITGQDGQGACSTNSITVQPLTCQLNTSETSYQISEPVTFTATDGPGNPLPSATTGTIDYGDSTTSPPATYSWPNLTTSNTHTYTNPSPAGTPYTAALTIADTAGNTATCTKQLTITPIFEGAAVSIKASKGTFFNNQNPPDAINLTASFKRAASQYQYTVDYQITGGKIGSAGTVIGSGTSLPLTNPLTDITISQGPNALEEGQYAYKALITRMTKNGVEYDDPIPVDNISTVVVTVSGQPTNNVMVPEISPILVALLAIWILSILRRPGGRVFLPKP